MTYLPGVPSPEPTIDDEAFWANCSKRELRFQRCTNCKRFRNPPMSLCRYCGSPACEWVEAKDEAELFSFTVVNYPSFAGIDKALPYNVAIVLFPSFDNVRLISNVIDAKPDELVIGSKLSLVWEDSENGIPLPRFRKKVGSR